jgi:hypothetical protein
MRTITTHHLQGRILLRADIVKSKRDFASVQILERGDSPIGDVTLILADADLSTIEEAVAAFNAVMARGEIKQAAE